jgi:hypothetical protein
MNRRKTVLVAVVALALVAAGAAGAVGMRALRLGLGLGRPTTTGIAIHGKWTLVVHAKNGTVVARRHFENSLTASGQNTLVDLLLGGTAPAFGGGGVTEDGNAAVVGGQAVNLDDGSAPGGGQGCNGDVDLVEWSPCFVSHLNGDVALGADPSGSGQLHIAVSGGTLTLSGSATPPRATSITKVETMLKDCVTTLPSIDFQTGTLTGGFDDIDPKDCGTSANLWNPFTSKSLPTPLPVAAGQSVAFTVELSFS